MPALGHYAINRQLTLWAAFIAQHPAVSASLGVRAVNKVAEGSGACLH